jgi:acetyl esterase/lipase
MATKFMNKNISTLLIALFCAGLAFAGGAQERGALAQQEAAAAPQANASAVTIEKNVLYASVNGTELHLDVYKPAERGAGLLPGVVLIHGGGWTEFDKSTMRSMGMLLARYGFVAFSVDYRLFHEGENAWPVQLDDVQRAVRERTH